MTTNESILVKFAGNLKISIRHQHPMTITLMTDNFGYSLVSGNTGINIITKHNKKLYFLLSFINKLVKIMKKIYTHFKYFQETNNNILNTELHYIYILYKIFNSHHGLTKFKID